MYSFTYHRPGSVMEALECYRSADDGLYMAGGQTLIPTLKQRLAAPSDLIDLGAIAELTGVDVAPDRVSIGAFTRHSTVAAHPDIRRVLPVLADLAAQIGDAQVRNMGTMGGSVANSDPAADYPAALVGLGATVHTSSRRIAADEFFQDLFETALTPGELILRIDFPVPRRAAYRKFPNPASRYAIAGVLVAEFDDAVRVGITGAGPCAFRGSALEEALRRRLDPASIDGVEVPDAGFNSDLHASAEYRAQLVRVMARRAVADLLSRGS
ncbi:MAG: xanthine dehydrogenase family protein subunit M [Pseudomonadales bacterium]|nr:xanthine dehydrogenase family protein subunit M [Pseudomonadales bacterium]